MRYLIHKDKASELLSRKQYIEKVANVWFIKKEDIGSFIVLESMPSTYNSNICIIYGHNYQIDYLLNVSPHLLPETNLYIISCQSIIGKYKAKGKNIYLAPQNHDELNLLDGKQYGFSFDISEVELNLYNCPEKSFRIKLNKCFSLSNSVKF